MSVERRRLPSVPSAERLVAVVFGDRVGVALFLGALAFVGLTWRVGFLITDNYTVANALVNVAEGHLTVDRIVYGPPSGDTPGMVVRDGRRYGRNYGLVVAALPFLWGLRALAAVADLRVALAALWSLLALGAVLQVGAVLDRRRAAALGGSLLALVAFAANVAVATPLDPRWVGLLALQASTATWAALLAVVVYRLTLRVADRRVGTVAGAATVLATPVGFWATVPKRHVLVSLLALLAAYAFYRSRASAAPAERLRFRALAYAAGGLGPWVFPLEGALLLAVLVPLDLLTARSNGPRALATVGAALFLSLVPFLATNALVTGNPVVPPDLLPGYGGESQLTGGGSGGGGSGTPGTGGGGSGGGSGGGASTPGPSGDGTAGSTSLVALVVAVAAAAADQFGLLWSTYVLRGVGALFEPDRVVRTFVHSGYVERVASEDAGEAINLALLESTPLLAALAAAPVAVAGALRADGRDAVRRWLATPAGQTDLLLGGYALLVTLVYLPLLPQHAMITVRYLLPVVPCLVYALARLAPVRRAVREEWRSLAVAYAGGVLVGGQLLLLWLLVASPARGEAVQLHAWLGLAAAAPLGGWAALAAAGRDPSPGAGAVCLGLAAAATTTFLLLAGGVYFAFVGEFVLPAVQRASERLALG